MRVYVPATVAELRSLVDSGVLAAGLTAFAVTPGLREWYVDDDVDELEYAAMLEAARASLRLLDSDPDVPRRRVVLAADVADADVTVRDDLDRGVVRLAAPVPIATIASVHVDDAEAADTVAAAAEAVIAADIGDPDAQERVDDAEGFELSWYATQEIASLLESMS
jgi:hypothetical protein